VVLPARPDRPAARAAAQPGNRTAQRLAAIPPGRSPRCRSRSWSKGANIQTLSDNWYLARYRGLPECGNVNTWSLWAGGPGGTPLDQRAQLALGWVKRVVDRLNPFDARVDDFHSNPTNTFVEHDHPAR
jgi:hypothetical protein